MESDAFLRLQPFCVAVCKQRSSSAVDDLRRTLETIPEEAIEKLQDYILFPLRLLLKLPLTEGEPACKDRTVESVVECLCHVLKKSRLRHPEAATEIFTSLCLRISHPSNHGRVYAGASEETKAGVARGLEAVVRAAEDDVRKSLCSMRFLPALGHAVSMLLSLSETEASSEVSVTALRSLLALETLLPREQASVCFGTFLPGISLAMLNIMKGDSKQNHKVTCGALEVFASSVTLVMAEDVIKNDASWREGMVSTEVSEKVAGLLVEKNKAWRTATWAKLDVVIKNLCPVTSHPHWKVRLMLLSLVEEIIVQCFSCDYENLVKYFAEISVSLLADDNHQVRAKSSQVVERFSATGGDRLRDAASDLLRDAALQLPQSFRSCDEAEKLRRVRALHGYLLVLNSELKVALLLSAVLNKLCLAFLQILEMDVDDLRIIQRLPSTTLNTASFESEALKPRLRFKWFSDDRISKVVEQCLECIGKFLKDEVDTVCDRLLENVGKTIYRNQAVFMLNRILIGAAAEPSDEMDLAPLIKGTIIPLYLSDDLIHARVSFEDTSANRALKGDSTQKLRWHQSQDDNDNDNSFHDVVVSRFVPELNSNILLVSLTLEGIASCARVLKGAFRPLLIKTLYPVVEKVGSDVTMIQDAAYLALGTVASECGYTTVKELLFENADYIVNQLRIELKHGFLLSYTDRMKRRHSHSPQVLEALLKNGGHDLLPLLRDTIEEILDCLDMGTDPDNCRLFMKVLASLMLYLQKWFAGEHLDHLEKNNNEEEEEKINETNVTKYFEDYIRNSRIVENLEVNDDDELELGQPHEYDDGIEDEIHDEPHKEPEVPYYVKIAEEVMTRCVYLMPDENPRLRVLVLDVTQSCCRVLRKHENTLLPLAHLCWKPFVNRLRDKDHFVMKKAFETLVVLSESCGDFLLQRFTKDVVPPLVAFMLSQGEISSKLSSSSAYRFTVAFKLQLSILKGIGPICRTIRCRVETGLDDILTFAFLHLRSDQPIDIQDAAKQALTDLTALNSDLVWLRASALAGNLTLTSRDKNFPLDSLNEIISLC